MTRPATYVFAITRPAPAPELAGLHGIDDAAVRTVAEGDLAAITCDVSLAEFGEQPLQEHLEDLAWLEKTARVHDLVVRLVAQQVTTAPLRMATIYRDDDAVRGLLRTIAADASAVLARLEDRDEWGVKLYAVPQESGPEPARGASGADYLRRRRSALTSRQDAAGQAAEDTRAIYARLSEVSVEARAHRPQDPQLSGVAAPMLLNGAFLVDRSGAAGFSQMVKELAESHANLRFTLTGPWPPYSFASLDQPG